MKMVDRKTGSLVDVPDDQADGLFRSGMFGFLPGAVPISSPGVVGTVDAKDAQAALEHGMSVPNEAAFRQAQLEQRFGGVGGGLEAAGVGALRGGAEAFGVPFDAAAIGAADALGDAGLVSGQDVTDPYRGRRHLTAGDRLRGELMGLEQAHPYASQAGELAGLVGAGIATGGESFLGEVGGAGEAAARALGGGRIARGVARGIAEGAPLGGVSAINEAALGDTNVTAEKVVAGMGHGAFMGAGLGAAFSGLGVAKDAARDQIGRFASKLAPRDVESLAEKAFGYAPEGLGARVQKHYSRASAAASGKDAATIDRFTALTPEGAEARRVAVFDAPKILDESERSIRGHVDEILRPSEVIADEARGELKAEHVDRAVRKGNEAEARAFTVDELDRIIAGATEQLNDPAGVAPNMKKSLKNVITLAERARAGAFGGGDVDPNLRFKWHSTAKPQDGMTTVMVDADALDSAWSMDRSFYIGEGEEGIAGRRKGFQAWREANPDAPIEASRINVDRDGRAAFSDGRHRFAELRDAGVDRVAVSIPKTELRNLGPEWNVGPLADTAIAATKNGQYFIALDRIKRAMQRYSSKGTQGIRNLSDPLDMENAQRALDWFKGSAEQVRAGLEDEALWGKAAKDQRAINAAWRKQLLTSHKFHASLTTETTTPHPDDPYRMLRGADPAKVSSYVRSLTNPHADMTHAAIKEYVASTEELATAIERSYDLTPDKLAEVARLRDAAKGFRSTLAKAEGTISLANQYRALTEGTTDSLSALLGTVGGIFGGLPGGVLGAAAGAVANPGRVVAQLAAVERLSMQVDTRIGSSIRDFFRGGSRRPAPALEAEVSTPKGFDIQVRQLTESVDADGNITPLGRERIANAIGDLGDGAPKLATAVGIKAMQVATFLAGKVPPAMRSPYEMFPGEEPPLVSDAERATFARYVAAANDPMSVVDHLARGDVTPEESEVLKTCYPRLYEIAQSQIDAANRAAQAKGKPIDYGKRVTYGILFEVRTDATMDPEVLMAVSSARAKRSGKGGMGGGMPAPSRLRGAPSLAGRFATNSEAAASRRRGGGGF